MDIKEASFIVYPSEKEAEVLYYTLRHDINRVCAHPAGCPMPAEKGSMYCHTCNTERL